MLHIQLHVHSLSTNNADKKNKTQKNIEKKKQYSPTNILKTKIIIKLKFLFLVINIVTLKNVYKSDNTNCTKIIFSLLQVWRTIFFINIINHFARYLY